MRAELQHGLSVAAATPDDLVWAADVIGIERWAMDTRGVTVWRGQERKAVAAYNLFNNRGCMVHMATDGSRSWASREVIAALYGYPFNQLGLDRISAATPAHNTRSIILGLKLGFEIEARTRNTAIDGSDEVILTMWRGGCPWIRE